MVDLTTKASNWRKAADSIVKKSATARRKVVAREKQQEMRANIEWEKERKVRERVSKQLDAFLKSDAGKAALAVLKASRKTLPLFSYYHDDSLYCTWYKADGYRCILDKEGMKRVEWSTGPNDEQPVDRISALSAEELVHDIADFGGYKDYNGIVSPKQLEQLVPKIVEKIDVIAQQRQSRKK